MGRVPRLPDVLRQQAVACLMLWFCAMCAGPALAEEAAKAQVAPTQPPARIMVMNREVAVLSGSVFGVSANQRALEAEARIDDMLHSGGRLVVGTQDADVGTMVQVDGATMFAITPGDTPDRSLSAARLVAQRSAAKLQQGIEESRESRDTGALLRGLGVTLIATLVLFGLVWGLRQARRKVSDWLIRETVAHTDRLKVGGQALLNRGSVIRLAGLLLNAVFWLIALLVVYEWLSLTLGQFAFTRAWAEQLNGFLWGLLRRFVLGIAYAVPDLVAAGLIFWLAYVLAHGVKSFFAKVGSGQIRIGWLEADVASTTSKLCVVAIWLFALAMAYSYLPGSDTEAFKGLSVLVGLMLSLGASNLVGQVASGLILTYTHAFRNGEYVRIEQHEGTVVNLGTFTTRIRTGMGEELTISNSQVLGAVTRNYSRTVKGQGFIVDTTVTIGYDAPWRQVNAMLVEAARRTPGVLADPAPHVFQVALSDFYPEYRLVCQAVPTQPRPRAEIMSLLHQNIQDLFNEHGVQIMSPHYLGDPDRPKVVPQDQWYAAPAKGPGTKG